MKENWLIKVFEEDGTVQVISHMGDRGTVAETVQWIAHSKATDPRSFKRKAVPFSPDDFKVEILDDGTLFCRAEYTDSRIVEIVAKPYSVLTRKDSRENG